MHTWNTHSPPFQLANATIPIDRFSPHPLEWQAGGSRTPPVSPKPIRSSPSGDPFAPGCVRRGPRSPSFACTFFHRTIVALVLVASPKTSHPSLRGTANHERACVPEKVTEHVDRGVDKMVPSAEMSVQELADALREVPGVEAWLADGAAEAVACASTRVEAENVVRGYLRDAPLAWKAVERYLESTVSKKEVKPKQPPKRKERARRKARANQDAMESPEDEDGPTLLANDPKRGWEDRKVCGCLATRHKPVGNCLACGRIACEEEGEGTCCFCNTYVLRVEEVTKDQADAIRREAATRVLDDQCDFFQSTAG